MKNNRRLRQFLAIVSSAKFFWGIVGLLILQAAWIALSGHYPMAFDEDFHLGIIRLYADHIRPFWAGHPAGGDAFGAVARDPSYLYHYLMSFPYRLLSAITDNAAVHVLALRAISIGLFAGGLVFYRRLLLKTGASLALVHLSLLVFVLIPVVPLTAAQINYDNLIMPLVALALLLTLKVYGSLRHRSVNLTALLQLLLVCLSASLVKYAFLPVFAAIVVFLAAGLYKNRSRELSIVNNLSKNIATAALITGLLIIGVLFAERYGGNLVRYQTPVPDCGQVLNYDECRHYGPWIRDYRLEQNKSVDATASPLTFTGEWFEGMWLRSFFAVAGPGDNFQTRGPLAAPAISVIVFALMGLAAFVLTVRQLWRRYNAPALSLLMFTTAVYVLILWAQQYGMFLQTGKPVAINGRYLLLVMPFLVLTTALAISQLLGARRGLKALLAVAVILCFLWGGGAMTYVLRSSDHWYWDNEAVKKLNNTLQDTLGPLTPGYRNKTLFL